MILLICLLLASHYATAAPPAASGPDSVIFDFEGTYLVDFTTDVDGGCQSYEQEVRISFAEAFDVACAGLSAAKSVQQDLPSSSRTIECNDWLRRARVWRDMFGLQVSTIGGQGHSGQAVIQHFEDLVAFHGPMGPTPNRKAAIKCGDSWLQWYDANDGSPKDGSQKVRDDPEVQQLWAEAGNQAQVLGAYFAASPITQKRWYWSKELEPKSPHPLCDDYGLPNDHPDGWLASVDADRILTLCPRLLDRQRWSIDPSNPDAEVVISVQPGTDIEKVSGSIAHTLVHEWGHLIRNMDDQRLTRDIQRADSSDDTVYSWASCIALARASRQRALVSPENYAYFALAMYLEDWWWLDGVPQARDPHTGGKAKR